MARIVVDIDGVVAEDTGDHRDYADRKPLDKGIAMVQKLKADGHEVIFHTARWKRDRTVTKRWLKKHKVPYDELILGKPRADLYIDDRALRWPCSPGGLWRAVWTGGGPNGSIPPGAQRRAVERLQRAAAGHPRTLPPGAIPDPT